ncbi:MAG: hypothetical protein E7419_08350 [Ruminococcaceae bacterium]|nr:hypothetical protein [Oscillospiraceae bacterium]
MDYKGYTFKFGGVYKVENNVKLYSLEIHKDGNKIFKSDYVYSDSKRAFKDAKEMVKKKTFSSDIVNKNTEKENYKKDSLRKNKKANKIANMVILTSIILTIISLIVSIFGIIKLDNEVRILTGIYVGIGLGMSSIMLYYGVFIKEDFELNNKHRMLSFLIWMIVLFYDDGSHCSDDDEPFENKKGWSSATAIITLFFEALFGIGIVIFFISANDFGLAFWGIVISYFMLIINYIFCIVWEISDAYINMETFPYNKVIMPPLAILIIIAFCYIFYLIK